MQTTPMKRTTPMRQMTPTTLKKIRPWFDPFLVIQSGRPAVRNASA